MKTTIQVLIALAQFIIALLIVMGILPIIALAWLMVATGALVILSLLVAGIAAAALREV